MARKADKVTYENKAEIIGIPEKVRIEVVKPHDGLVAGYQSLKPYGVAKRMIELGYWKEVKSDESNKVSAGK